MLFSRPWILIAVLVLVILFAILAIIAFHSRKEKKRRPIDYYSWFLIGLIWVVFGIISGNTPLAVIGLVFLIPGLTHKKDWKKNREANCWKNLNKTERIVTTIMIVTLSVLVLAGIIALFLTRNGFS